MSEGTTMSTGRIVCPFYSYSSCRDSCEYIHGATCSDFNSNNYSFFVKASCKYGDQFRNNYTEIAENVISAPVSAKNEDRATEKSESMASISSLDSCNNLINDNSALVSAKNDDQAAGPSEHKASISSLDSRNNGLHAHEFVPASKRHSTIVLKSNDSIDESVQETLDLELCQHFIDGACPFDNCPGIHGDLCESCLKYCLNPLDENQRNLHAETCGRKPRISHSLDKKCGICLEVVSGKVRFSERRFGILERCNHVFCLSCIKRWRKADDFVNSGESVDVSIARACPECRVFSDFIIPSQIWADSGEKKEKLISDYKTALSTIHCKYFRRGRSECPLNDVCFYLHALPNGFKVSKNVVRRLNPRLWLRPRRLKRFPGPDADRDSLMAYLDEMLAELSEIRKCVDQN